MSKRKNNKNNISVRNFRLFHRYHHLGVSTRKTTRKFNPLKTLPAIARLEVDDLTHRDRPRPVIYENKNLSNLSVNPMYNYQNLNFVRDREICKRRKERRDEIMRKTKGSGLRVSRTTWNADSYVQCK